nr:MAG TPA: hypothetical protein [Caudoviricetes sp.]
MQNTAGSSCLGHSCTKIVQLFLIIQKQKSLALSVGKLLSVRQSG